MALTPVLSWSRRLVGVTPEKKDSQEHRTDSGIEIQPVYRPRTSRAGTPRRKLGEPGAFPYTRGIHADMYRSKLWTMRQYAGFGTAESTNERFKFLLDAGQTGLSCAFDLPTQMGYDSDHPRAEGEVGKVGVAIDSLADMRLLMADLPLDKVTTSMTINATAAILLLLYQLVAEEHGVPGEKIRGTIQNDILKEYVARGTYIYPPRPSMRLIIDTFSYCAEQPAQLEHHLDLRLPHPRGRLDGGPGDRLHPRQRHRLRRGGARRRPGRRRLRPAAVASSGTPTTTSSRRWPSTGPPGACGPRIMTERFGAKDERSQDAALPHPDRRLDPDRPAAGEQHRPGHPPGLAAALGRHPEPAHQRLRRGPRPAHRRGRPRSPCAPSRSSATSPASPTPSTRWPARTSSSRSPTRSSRRPRSTSSASTQLGGAVAAIEARFMQEEIEEAAYSFAKAVDDGEKIVVGVNRFTDDEGEPTEVFPIDVKLQQIQIDRTRSVRAERDQAAVDAALADVARRRRGDGNLLVPMKAALRRWPPWARCPTSCGACSAVYQPGG